MNAFRQSSLVTIVIAAFGFSSLLAAEKKDKQLADKDKPAGTVHTVIASVQQSAGFIQAELVPGLFTVREGFKASNLKFSYHDPKTGIRGNKLDSRNIYSVTQRRYMHELNKDPNFVLPPGDYKFVVGGLPGATGSLTYTTVPAPGVKPPPGDAQPDPRTHKPPMTDTPKTDVKRDPLHPGGEGKRKATLHMTSTTTDASGATTWSGDIPVTLVISAGKMQLEYPKDMQGVIERWNGTLARQGEVVTVNGTTERNYSFHGGQSTTEWKGTFAGKLEGTVLKGTVAAHAEQKFFGKVDGTAAADLKGEWSIKDFVK